MKRKQILALIASSLMAGCASTTVTQPDGSVARSIQPVPLISIQFGSNRSASGSAQISGGGAPEFTIPLEDLEVYDGKIIPKDLNR